MRNASRIVGSIAVALLGITPALAVEGGIGLRAGTYGLGLEGGVGVTEWFSLRGGYYGLDVSETVDEGGIEYDGSVELGGYGLLADFFPMRGGFHLTAGWLVNRNEIEVVATPTEPQEIGDTTYDPSEVGSLSGAIEFDDNGPYFGIGWGNVARGKRVGFLFDAGVIRQGSGEVTLAASSSAVDPEDVAEEAVQIEDDISDYDLWPILSAGIAIRF